MTTGYFVRALAGKSSLFNLLGDSAHAQSANFPFCTIDPNIGRCAVPDERYDFLCDLWSPPSKICAFLDLVDIAGLIKGASTGAGLGNAFLSHISAVDGIFHVVRAFENDEVLHVDDSVDPVRDMEVITGELCAKDVGYVEAQRAAREAEIKKNPKMKLPPVFFTVMDRCAELLRNNQPIGKAGWNAAEIEKINEVIPQALTTKPVIYLINIGKKDFVRGGNKHLAKIKKWIDEHGGGVAIPISVEFEEELAQLKEDDDEQGVAELLGRLKGRGSAVPKAVSMAYKELSLMYFFTAGEKEVRCWTVMEGVTAPEAAGVIHSDFERGFIKAEVCSFEDFKEHYGGKKSMAGPKAAGTYRQEGKSYVVKSGDIIHFQFNVTASSKK
jgi:obg-like ATPase 1